jgi:L-threonylcarbamoyladenylate synthase
MRTAYWDVRHVGDPKELFNHPAIITAAERLLAGELIAFPTETVYGLGADARSSSAVKKIFQTKGRPQDNPLIVHVADTAQLESLIEKKAKHVDPLIRMFWPGPLTLVLPVRENAVVREVTAGLATLAVRMPANPVALSLIRRAGAPLAAPSANLSGRPSPTTAQHVMDDLGGLIAGVIDGGVTDVGLESTVLDLSVSPPAVLRPGAITAADLQPVIGELAYHPPLSDDEGAPKAPGMKYRHYAPKAKIKVIAGEPLPVKTWINENIANLRGQGEKVGVLAVDEHRGWYRAADEVIHLGPSNRLDEIGQHFYGALRRFDQTDVTMILAESLPQEGIGSAIMNRLLKAAGGDLVKIE